LKKKVKGLGGRGKLTERTIERLQNYYSIAIRSNPNNLPAMQKAATTTILHTVRLEKTVGPSFRRIKQPKHQHTNTDLACHYQLLSI